MQQESESDGSSLVWSVCQSQRHARARRGHDIIATVAVEAAGCELSCGRAGSHHSSVCLQTYLCVCFARTNVHLSMWRIYFGKNANLMAFQLSCTCVCHHDTPVPAEDTASPQPSTSLRPSSMPRRLLASHQED